MINENSIELAFIEQLESQGYNYYPGPDIAPYSGNPQRKSFESVVLENHFKASLVKVNLRDFSSSTDQGEFAKKWCSDWGEDIPTTFAISGSDFLLIGEIIP